MSVCSSGKIAYGPARVRTVAADRRMRTYLCRECGWWHLTSSEPSSDTKLRAPPTRKRRSPRLRRDKRPDGRKA